MKTILRNTSQGSGKKPVRIPPCWKGPYSCLVCWNPSEVLICPLFDSAREAGGLFWGRESGISLGMRWPWRNSRPLALPWHRLCFCQYPDIEGRRLLSWCYIAEAPGMLGFGAASARTGTLNSPSTPSATACGARPCLSSRGSPRGPSPDRLESVGDGRERRPVLGAYEAISGYVALS